MEDARMPVRDVYRLIQEAVAPRILVDKSPTYSIDRAALDLAELYFEAPLYIHLVRHPCGMIRSYETYHLDHFVDRAELDMGPRQAAEVIWVAANRNILEFLGGVPPGRHHRVRFEDLVRAPEATLVEVCRFLGIGYDSEMARPYNDKGRKMTDGIKPHLLTKGDKKFHSFQEIDPSVASNWSRHMTSDFLGGPARALASLFGYDDIPAPVPPAASRLAPIPRLPRDEAERVLARLDQLSDDEVQRLLEDLSSTAHGGTGGRTAFGVEARSSGHPT
jgi:hypothetical protein